MRSVLALILFCPLFAAIELLVDVFSSPLFVLLVVAGIGAVGWTAFRRFTRQRPSIGLRLPLDGMLTDVAAVRLGIDAAAREAVQVRLSELARTHSTRTKADLVALLRETVAALLAADHAWRFATVTSTTPRPRPAAEGLFRAVAQEARARFTDEVVRNVDGRLVTSGALDAGEDAPAHDALVVVTVVVAARREIPDLAGRPEASAVRDLLRDLATLEERDLVALEVVWSPADVHEHVDEAAILTRYPELVALRGVGLDGRAHCGYRCPPYDATLPRCPACGAPREG